MGSWGGVGVGLYPKRCDGKVLGGSEQRVRGHTILVFGKACRGCSVEGPDAGRPR